MSLAGAQEIEQVVATAENSIQVFHGGFVSCGQA
jgi:hypothetical protein